MEFVPEGAVLIVVAICKLHYTCCMHYQLKNAGDGKRFNTLLGRNTVMPRKLLTLTPEERGGNLRGHKRLDRPLAPFRSSQKFPLGRWRSLNLIQSAMMEVPSRWLVSN